MDERETWLAYSQWQFVQPRQSFVSKGGTGRRGYLTNHRPHAGRGRGLAGELLHRVWPNEHFVDVAHNTLPPQVTDLIDYLDWTRPHGGQIASVKHYIRRHLTNIRQHCCECSEVPVDVR